MLGFLLEIRCKGNLKVSDTMRIIIIMLLYPFHLYF
jgi:hypothetical protein